MDVSRVALCPAGSWLVNDILNLGTDLQVGRTGAVITGCILLV
jgi:hypothetical protein